MTKGWPEVRILEASDDAGRTNPLGKTIQVTARVALGGLSPEDVRVEVLVGKAGANRELLGTRVETLSPGSQEEGTWRFSSEIDCDVPGHQGLYGAGRSLPRGRGRARRVTARRLGSSLF